MELLSRRLRQFLIVAQTNNIHKAAEHLHMAQPALSRAMKLLEEEMAVRLLIREPRGVSLTPAGERLVETSRQALLVLEQGVVLARESADQLKGRINIGYGIFASLGHMPNLIVDFRKQFPEIDIQLSLLASIDQLKALEKRQIDVSFGFSIAAQAPLKSCKISQEKPVILVNKTHRWANERQLDIRALASEPMVVGNMSRWGYYRDIVNSICLNAGFMPTVAAQADHLPDFISHLRMGEGVGMMGEAIIDQIPKSLRAIAINTPTLTFDQSMIWDGKHVNPLSQLFIDYVHDKTKSAKS